MKKHSTGIDHNSMMNYDMLKEFKSPRENKLVNAPINTELRTRGFKVRNNVKYGSSQRTKKFNNALCLTRSRSASLRKGDHLAAESVCRTSDRFSMKQAVEVVSSHGVVDIKSSCNVSVFVSSQYNERRITQSQSVLNSAHQNNVIEKFPRTASSGVLTKPVLHGVEKWKQPAACSALNKNKWKSKRTGVLQMDNTLPAFNSYASVYVVDTERVASGKDEVKIPELKQKFIQLGPPCPEVTSGSAEVVCVNAIHTGNSALHEASTRASLSSNLLLKPHSKNNSLNSLKSQNVCIPNEASADVATLNHQEVDSVTSQKHTISVRPKNKTVSIKKRLMMVNVDEPHDFSKTTSQKSCNSIVKNGTKDKNRKKNQTKKVKRLKRTVDKVSWKMNNKDEIQYYSNKTCVKHLKKTLKSLRMPKVIKKRKMAKQQSLPVVAATVQQIKKGKHTVDAISAKLNKTVIWQTKKENPATEKGISLKTVPISPRLSDQKTKKENPATEEGISLKTVPISLRLSDQKTKKGKLGTENSVVPLKASSTYPKIAIHQVKKEKQATKGSTMSFKDQQKSPRTRHSDQDTLAYVSNQCNALDNEIATCNHFDNWSEKSNKPQLCKSNSQKLTSMSSDYSSSSEDDIVRMKNRRLLRKPPTLILKDSDSEADILIDQDNIVLTPTVMMDLCPAAGISPTSKPECEGVDVPNSKSNDHPSDTSSDTRRSLELKLEIPDMNLVKNGQFWKEEYMNGLNHDQLPLVALSRLDDKTGLLLDESDNDIDIYSVSSGSSLHGVDFSMVEQGAVKDVDMIDNSMSFSESEETEEVSNNYFKSVDIQSCVCKKPTTGNDCLHYRGRPLDTSKCKHSLADRKVNCDKRHNIIKNADVATGFEINNNTDNAKGLFSSREDGEMDTSYACSPFVQTVLDKRIHDKSSLVTDSCFDGNSAHVIDNRNLGVNVIPFSESLLRDGDYDELDGGNNFVLTPSCERVTRKKVSSCYSFKDVLDEEKQYKIVSESMDENFNREDTASSSSCQSSSERSVIAKKLLCQSSSYQSGKTNTIEQSSFHDDDSSNLELEYRTSKHDEKSLQNLGLCLSDDKNTFVKNSSDIVTDRDLVLDTSGKHLPGAACDKGDLDNEMIQSPGSSDYHNCQTPVCVAPEFSVESICKQMLSSHHYDGTEQGQREESDSDMSVNFKKGLEDMLDNLRDVEAWTSPSSESQTDSLTSRNMDSLSDIVLDDLVIDEGGIDCMVTIPTNVLKADHMSHQGDLYLIQEALDCLGPNMLGLENLSDSGNKTPATHVKPSEPTKTVILSPSSECQEGICVQEKNVLISQKKLQSESEAGQTFHSKKIGKLPISEVCVVLERLDLKNTSKVGDLHLNKIDGVERHSWKVTYDNVSPMHCKGDIKSPCDIRTDTNTGSSPMKPGKMVQKADSKEYVFQTGKDHKSENEKERTYSKKLIWNDQRKSDSVEIAIYDRSGLHRNIDSEISLTGPLKSKDVADNTDFGKAITAPKSKTKKLKKTKILHHSSAETETDKSQGSQKSQLKVVLPVDTLSKPKSKLAQKILRQREKERAASKNSATSLPSLEIAPFKDIISSNFLKSSDTNVFGLSPKVTFGRSFRKTDQSKLSDLDPERHRSPLDLCLTESENVKFKTVKEPQLSLFKSPKSPANHPSFVFGDTNVTNDLSKGKHSLLDLSTETDPTGDSPESLQKDSTVKSELLSRLESVLNSSSSLVLSPSSPRSSTPVARRKQQIVMFSPIVRSTSVSSIKENDIPIVAQAPSTKSILKNSTSNILAELKSGSSASVEMRQLNKQNCLKIQDSPCSGSVLSSDAFETSDDGFLEEDFMQRIDSCDKYNTGLITEFDANTLDFSRTKECQLIVSEENAITQESFNETHFTDDDNILMTYQCGALPGVCISGSVQKNKELQSDSTGSQPSKENVQFILENPYLDTTQSNNLTTEDLILTTNVSSHMDSNHVCSGNITKFGNGPNKMDDDSIGTGGAAKLADGLNKMDGIYNDTGNTTKLENEQSLGDGNHPGTADTKTNSGSDMKGGCIRTSSVDDSSFSTYNSMSSLLLTNLSSIMTCDDDAEVSTNNADSTHEEICEEMTSEYLEGYGSQVEGSLLALSSECDNLSINSEICVNDADQDFGGNSKTESDKISESHSKESEMSSMDKTSDQELSKVESKLVSSADESGLEADDDESSLDSSDNTANEDDEKLDDDNDDDALSLLAPSDASFLSEFDEEPDNEVKCKKASVEIVAHNQEPSLESCVVKLEEATDSTQGKSESQIASRDTGGSQKIAESAVKNKDNGVQKTAVASSSSSITTPVTEQNKKSLETLRGMIEQNNLFGCLDVVKQIQNQSRMTSVQAELPSDVLMGIIDVTIHFSYISGTFYMMKKLYTKPQLLTAQICNRVLRMCHPFRRDCLPELLEMFDIVSSHNIIPDIDCLVSLIRAFIESENWHKVWQVLKYACESTAFLIPIRVQEMACQTCLNNPDEYAVYGIQWLRNMLKEQFVEYLQDVNQNILVDMAEICISLNERDVAVELKMAVSPISSISIDFEDQNEAEICSTYREELKIFANRIKGCSVTKNWRYLAQTFIDVCAIASTSNRQLVQTYCDVFLESGSTQQIVHSFTEFLRDVVKEFERDCRDSPLLKLDYSTIGQIGRMLMFHCHQAKMLNHSYTLLSKILEFKLPCRSQNVVIDQKFLIVAMESCIHMEECHRCVRILEGFNWNAEHMSNVKELNRFLYLMMKLLDIFLRRNDCKSATKILSAILSQKEIGNKSILSGPDFSHLVNSLICKAVHIGDIMSAVDMFNLHISVFYMPALDFKTVRLLFVSCAESGLLEEAASVFIHGKKLGIYKQPNVMEVPRELLLSSMLTPTEVLFIIQDFLQELYNYLCSQTLDGHILTCQELKLSLRIVMYSTEIVDEPFLSVFPQCIPAAQNMVLSIVRQDLEPPLAASVTMIGLIEINWKSLEIYLQNLDQKGNRQGLHFMIPAFHGVPRLPADQDLRHLMYDQRNVSSRGFPCGGLRSQHMTELIRPPNPRRGSRRGGSSISSHPQSWPPPLESLNFEDMDFLQRRPPLLQGPLLLPDRFHSDEQCLPHVRQSLERPLSQLQRRPPRGRGRWSTKNSINNIQK